MKILHPCKSEYLDLDQLDSFYQDGYYKILNPKDESNLNHFLSKLEEYRVNDKIEDVALYANLPFSIQSETWKARVQDVKVIDNLIGKRKNLHILDAGTWNGWLSNYLSKQGQNLVGTGIFTDEFDGLKSRKYYNSDFTLLQLMLNEIYRIQFKFDIIVFNRCWSYCHDPEKIFKDALNLIAKGGYIIFTGLMFYKNPKYISELIGAKNSFFEKKYEIPLFYNSTAKGYLDKSDKAFFKNNHIQLTAYCRGKNILKSILKRDPQNKYGVYLHEN